VLTIWGSGRRWRSPSFPQDFDIAALIPATSPKDEEMAAHWRLRCCAGRPLFIHAVVHSLASQPRGLERPFTETTGRFPAGAERERYSLVGVARAAVRVMTAGGSISTDLPGVTRVVPNYNVMGVAKAALEAWCGTWPRLGERGIIAWMPFRPVR